MCWDALARTFTAWCARQLTAVEIRPISVSFSNAMEAPSSLRPRSAGVRRYRSMSRFILIPHFRGFDPAAQRRIPQANFSSYELLRSQRKKRSHNFLPTWELESP